MKGIIVAIGVVVLIIFCLAGVITLVEYREQVADWSSCLKARHVMQFDGEFCENQDYIGASARKPSIDTAVVLWKLF